MHDSRLLTEELSETHHEGDVRDETIAALKAYCDSAYATGFMDITNTAIGDSVDGFRHTLRNAIRLINIAPLVTSSVTRVEVIDHSPTGTGRDWSKRNLTDVSLSLQDDGQTLKVFVR